MQNTLRGAGFEAAPRCWRSVVGRWVSGFGNTGGAAAGWLERWPVGRGGCWFIGRALAGRRCDEEDGAGWLPALQDGGWRGRRWRRPRAMSVAELAR